MKFKGKFGGSATPAIMKIIEGELARGAMPVSTPAKIEEVDLKAAYIEAVCKFADLASSARRKFKFAIDSNEWLRPTTSR